MGGFSPPVTSEYRVAKRGSKDCVDGSMRNPEFLITHLTDARPYGGVVQFG